MGTAQFLSVPYALFSRKSLTPGPAGPTGPKGDKGNPGDPASDDQTLSLEDNILRISNGNTVTLYFDDADADPENEIQYLTLLGDSLLITKGNGVKLSDFVDDADADPSNELQNLSLDGYILSISNGNTITLRDSVKDEDADPTNEIQDLQLNGNILKITNKKDANNIYLNPYLDNTDEQEIHYDPITHKLYLEQGGDTIDLSGLINDEDGDPGNEIQTLSKDGNTITLSKGGGTVVDDVDDADPDPTNEIQDLQLNGNILTITINNTPTEINLSAYLDDTDDQQISYDSGTNILSLENGGTSDLSDLRNIPLVGFRALKETTTLHTTIPDSTVMVFGNEVFDYGGGFNETNGQFTAPSDGVYSFTVAFDYEAKQTLKVLKNEFYYDTYFGGSTTSFDGFVSFSFLIYLNESETISIQVNIDNIGTCGIGSFSGFRVH